MADRWDSSLYDARHNYVWQKSADLLDLLDPQPGERILDLGCGTGHLTAQLAARGAEVTGIDSSASMIAQARQNFPKLKFVLGDARKLAFTDPPFDAVFSNAALHWIHEADDVAAGVARALKPSGRFVLEMGAKGNVAAIRRGIEETLDARGIVYRNPWYFPDAAEYSAVLERNGLRVLTAIEFERPVMLQHPEKGLREWLEMFAGIWFDAVPAAARRAVFEEIEYRTHEVLFHDGMWWADYRRLRVTAATAPEVPEC